MKKVLLSKNKICSIICIVLLVAVMAAQFLPYWHGEFVEETIKDGQKISVTDTSISVAQYVWFPKDHANFGKWLGATAAEMYGAEAEVDINSFVFVPAFQMLLAFIGIVALGLKLGKYQPAIFAGVTGVLGLYGFLTSPYLKLGSLQGLFIVINILLIIVFIFLIIICELQFPYLG